MITNLFKTYYPLFGGRGVWFAACARLRRTALRVAVEVPGIKHPVQVRLRSSDISTLQQVLVEAGYGCVFAKTPQVIVDAGANIGLTSVFYANRYPNTKIIAIEPVASNYAMLKINTAPYPGIVPVQGALWKEQTELDIVDPGAGEWGFQTVPTHTDQRESPGGTGKVRAFTMDQLIAEHAIDGIDLLKVDIEGSEKEVFEGAKSWIGRVGAIAVELHDQIKPGCKAAFDAAIEGFVPLGTQGETVFVARPGRVSTLGKAAPLPGGAEKNGSNRALTGVRCRITHAVHS
jgi:FkbM family methyltransferase